MKTTIRPSVTGINPFKVFRRLISAGTSRLPAQHARRVANVNKLSLVTALLAAPIGSMFYLGNHSLEILYGALAETVVFLGIILLNHLHFHRTASIGVLTAHCLGALYFSGILGPLIDIDLIIAFMLGMCFLVYAELKMQLTGAAITLITYFLIHANLIPQIIPQLTMSPADQQVIRSVAQPAFMFFNVLVFVGLLFQYRTLLARHTKYVNQFSHELRNNLNSQSLIVDKLLREIRKSPENRSLLQYVEELQIATENMSDISNNALGVAEAEAGTTTELTPGIVDIRSVIRRTTYVHRLKAKQDNITFSLEIPDDFPRAIYLHRHSVNRIMTNLVVNAVKYADPDSQIIVSVTSVPPGSFQFSISNACPDIPPELLNRLFSKFFTAKTKNVEGSGLGLFLVHDMVARLNGNIIVKSAGHVTTFTVTLPLLPAAEKEQPAIDLSDKHIIIVDDSPIMIKLAENVLSSYGCNVSTAAQGKELFSILADDDVLPDVILLDRHLPEMNGMKILKFLKSDPRLSGIPVVMYTGDRTEHDELIAAGAAAIQLKPADPRALASLIYSIT